MLGRRDPRRTRRWKLGLVRSPVDVLGITAATELSLGNHTACALEGGDIKCWGSGNYGFFNDGALLQEAAPTSVILAGQAAQLSVSGPASASTGVCSSFTITLEDSTGAAVNASANTTLNLSNGGTGSFYDTAGCGGASVSSVTLNSGSSSATFYYYGR